MSCSWDGISWTLGWESGHAHQLKAKATWMVNYRPSSVKVTFTGAPTARFYVSSLNYSLCFNDEYCSGALEALDFSYDEDILIFNLQASGGGEPYIQFDITNIEFFF